MPDNTVPSHIVEALVRYRETGAELGGFLMACVEGDLFKAVGRADLANRPRIPAIARYIFHTFPTEAYGSPANVRAWQTKKACGLEQEAVA